MQQIIKIYLCNLYYLTKFKENRETEFYILHINPVVKNYSKLTFLPLASYHLASKKNRPPVDGKRHFF